MVLTRLVVAATVKAAAHAVAGTEVSLGASLRAVGLGLTLATVMLVTFRSFSSGTGITQFLGMSALLVLAAFLAAYVLGFKLALGVTRGSASLVALIETAITSLFFFALRRALS